MSPTAREVRFGQRQRAARRQAAGAALAVTVAMVLARTFHLGEDAIVLRLWFVALGLIGLGLLIGTARWGTEDRTVQGHMLEDLGHLPEPERRTAPSGLKQATSTVTLSLRSAAGRDRWLRAEVRSIVEARLALVEAGAPRRSTPGDADARLVANASRLSPQTWQLIRPDRPTDDSRTVGLTPDELAWILYDLERL